MSCPLVRMTYAIVVQLVVRHLAKVEVAGSSPVCRSLKSLEIQGSFCCIILGVRHIRQCIPAALGDQLPHRDPFCAGKAVQLQKKCPWKTDAFSDIFFFLHSEFLHNYLLIFLRFMFILP